MEATTNPKATTPLDLYIGAQVRKAREGAELTQAELAEQIGVSWQQVAKYEAGINRISASRLLQVAAVLRVPVDVLLSPPAEAA